MQGDIMLLSDQYVGYEYSHAHNLASHLTIAYYKGVFICMCKL